MRPLVPSHLEGLGGSASAPAALYADGGIHHTNPSPYGGSWAWCLVDQNGVRVASDWGYVTPRLITELATGQDHVLNGLVHGYVTNNQTELLAVVYGLEAVTGRWPGWCGVVYTDSLVTKHRLEWGQYGRVSWRGVPGGLVARLALVRHRADWYGMRFRLLCGHPTKADFGRGYGRGGYPVSEHNVWCDRMCTEAKSQHVRDDPGAFTPAVVEKVSRDDQRRRARAERAAVPKPGHAGRGRDAAVRPAGHLPALPVADLPRVPGPQGVDAVLAAAHER